MKTKLLFLLFFVLILVGTEKASAQCDSKKHTRQCIRKLRPQGYRFLKKYRLDGQEGRRKKIEKPYVFSRGNTYMITLSNGDEKNRGVYVTLFDSKRRPIASSYNKSKDEFYSAIAIKIQRTGIYYMSYSFTDTDNFCAASVVGFKR